MESKKAIKGLGLTEKQLRKCIKSAVKECEPDIIKFLKAKLPTNCFKCGISLSKFNLYKHQERCNFTPSKELSTDLEGENK